MAQVQAVLSVDKIETAVLVLDVHGYIARANAPALSLLGRDRLRSREVHIRASSPSLLWVQMKSACGAATRLPSR
jgi:hypothetical protein